VTFRRIDIRFALAAALAAVCVAAAPAPVAPTTRPTTRPAKAVAGAELASASASAPTPIPAVRPATTRPAPVRSEVGQTLIRRGNGAAPSTQPATTSNGPAPDAAVTSAAPNLELSKVAGALAIVLTLIFALRGLMKRAFGAAGAAGSSRSVVVLSRTVLAPKQQVMLLHVGRRLIVVGDSGGQMSTLSEITDPDEVAALVGQLRDEKLSKAAPAFGGLLGRLRNGMDAGGSPIGSSIETGPRRAAPASPEYDGALVDDDPAADPEADSTRQEIHGLLAKVRLISHQFKGT
jgi:flagellar biogenesis protein FliO